MVTIVKTDSGLPCDFPCIECDGTGEVEMTNEYFLQTATTEELEEWIDNITDSCYSCGINFQNNQNCPFGKCIDKEGCAVEWLKQPHSPK